MKNKVSKRKAFYIALATLVAISIWIYADLTGNPDGTARIVMQILFIIISKKSFFSTFFDKIIQNTLLST